MESTSAVPATSLTTTQIGAVGEALVAAGLTMGSGGRLSPFRPFADDDGTDLLVFDKITKKAIPVQIKCRTKTDDPKAETVQFDVRLKTYAQDGSGSVLAALLDGASIRTVWLIPAREFTAIATRRAGKLVMVASAKPGTDDRFRRFRHDSLAAVAQKILTDLPAV